LKSLSWNPFNIPATLPWMSPSETEWNLFKEVFSSRNSRSHTGANQTSKADVSNLVFILPKSRFTKYELRVRIFLFVWFKTHFFITNVSLLEEFLIVNVTVERVADCFGDSFIKDNYFTLQNQIIMIFSLSEILKCFFGNVSISFLDRETSSHHVTIYFSESQILPKISRKSRSKYLSSSCFQ
jgi:hypothetical protein